MLAPLLKEQCVCDVLNTDEGSRTSVSHEKRQKTDPMQQDMSEKGKHNLDYYKSNRMKAIMKMKIIYVEFITKDCKYEYE